MTADQLASNLNELSLQGSFGHKFRDTYFQVKPGFVPVNHGSFGLPPKVVLDKYVDAFREEMASPDTYHYKAHNKIYREAVDALAGFLNCPAENLALVTNATLAVNTILRSYPFQKGDKIVLFNVTYGACFNTVKFLAEYAGVVPVVVDLQLPMSHGAIVEKVKTVFEENDVKLALFDTVSSVPSVVFPFVELTKLCKQYNVLSLVDGAHGIGLVPLDFKKMGFEPDFFVTNVHKWCSVPKGCAIMYVDPKHHRTVQTLPITHSYIEPGTELTAENEGNLLISKFTFTGTTVFATLACIPTALKFRSEICGGEDKIRDYCYTLARKAGKLTEEKWPGAVVMENAENTLVSAMVTIFVPLAEFSTDFDAADAQQRYDFLGYVPTRIIEKHKTFVMVNFYAKQCILRFSCQIYNELSDYEYAIDAVRDVLQEYFQEKSE